MDKYIVVKDIVDRLAATIMLLIVWPILLIAIIIIKIEDPTTSPVYKTVRVGKNNKSFRIYKLRSMISHKERNGVKLVDSERILKIGKIIRKTSLDELPQLVNIVKGEMSFIGPRPLPVLYLPYYTKEELHRHDIKPGISGWAQVKGRNNLSWDEKFKLDLEYVKNISFKLDIQIFSLTIIKVFKSSDVVIRGTGQEVDFHKYRMEQQLKEPENGEKSFESDI